MKLLPLLAAALCFSAHAADIPWRDSDIAAILYLGEHANMDELRADPRYRHYSQQYPELAALEDFSLPGDGQETWFILPREAQTAITVRAFDITTNAEPESGAMLQQSTGTPLLLRTQSSYYAESYPPDRALIFDAPQGKHLAFEPEISRDDGSILLPEGDSPATLYDLAFKKSEHIAPSDGATAIPWEAGEQLGVLHLGYGESLKELRENPQYQYYLTYYPALASIQKYAAENAGTDNFLLIPRDPQATLTIHDASDDQENPASGKIRYQGKGEPILLRSDAEADTPDFTLILTGADGERLIYQPLYLADQQSYTRFDDRFAFAIRDLTLYPRIQPGTQDEGGGAVASIHNGEVSVVIVFTAEDSFPVPEADRQLGEKTYRVQKLTAPARGVYWYYPEESITMLAILTTDNTLEILNLEHSLFSGDFTTSGALVSDVQALSTVMSQGADTLFTIDSEDKLHPVPNALFGVEGSAPWQHIRDNGERHTLTLTNDWKIAYTIRDASGNTLSEQQGHYRMNSAGYADSEDGGLSADIRYTFSDGQSGVLRLESHFDDDGMTITAEALEGDASFASAPGQPARYTPADNS